MIEPEASPRCDATTGAAVTAACDEAALPAAGAPGVTAAGAAAAAPAAIAAIASATTAIAAAAALVAVHRRFAVLPVLLMAAPFVRNYVRRTILTRMEQGQPPRGVATQWRNRPAGGTARGSRAREPQLTDNGGPPAPGPGRCTRLSS